jgi:hypothetical protein
MNLINNGDSGLVVRTALNGALAGAFTPDMYGAAHISGVDDYAAINAALVAARAAGAPLLFARDVYRTKQTIVLASNDNIIIAPGVQVRGIASFTGTSVFRVGDPASGSIAQYVNIGGGGVIDCGNVADIGIDFANASFSRAGQLRIVGANIKGIRVGDGTALNTSYQCDLSSITVLQNNIANVSGSVGISYENATDSFVDKCYAIGYQTGFAAATGSGSIDFMACHAFIRPIHGVMFRAFDIQTNRNSLTACYADTPSNYGDNSITDLSCYFIHGNNNILRACRAFMTTSGANAALATDGLVSIIKTDREVNSSAEVMVGGSSGSFRWKQRVEGNSDQTLDLKFIDNGETYLTSASHNSQTAGTFRPLTTIVSGLPSTSRRKNSIAMVTDPSVGKGQLVYMDNAGTWRYVSDDSAA